jgi:hypothetical protein
MSYWTDLLGTVKDNLRIGLAGVRLKNIGGHLSIRNTGDTADANLTANKILVSGNQIEINSDAAGESADWKLILERPASGMTANVTLTLPPDDGSPGQVLTTDGSGALSWGNSSGSANGLKIDVTALAFGSSSTVSMFTLPASSTVSQIDVVVDTPFDGSPSMSVGVNGGSASKYFPSSYVDLTASAKTIFRVHPGEQANVSSESLEIYYTAGSATAGSARVLVHYGEAA